MRRTPQPHPDLRGIVVHTRDGACVAFPGGARVSYNFGDLRIHERGGQVVATFAQPVWAYWKEIPA